jgi:hypothetical protein
MFGHILDVISLETDNYPALVKHYRNECKKIFDNNDSMLHRLTINGWLLTLDIYQKQDSLQYRLWGDEAKAAQALKNDCGRNRFNRYLDFARKVITDVITPAIDLLEEEVEVFYADAKASVDAYLLLGYVLGDFSNFLTGHFSTMCTWIRKNKTLSDKDTAVLVRDLRNTLEVSERMEDIVSDFSSLSSYAEDYTAEVVTDTYSRSDLEQILLEVIARLKLITPNKPDMKTRELIQSIRLGESKSESESESKVVTYCLQQKLKRDLHRFFCNEVEAEACSDVIRPATMCGKFNA